MKEAKAAGDLVELDNLRLMRHALVDESMADISHRKKNYETQLLGEETSPGCHLVERVRIVRACFYR